MNPSIHIAMLTTVYGKHAIGGAEAQVAELARQLVKQGHRVTIITLGARWAQTQLAIDDKYQVTLCEVPLWQIYDPYALSDSPQKKAHHHALKRMAWHILDIANPMMRRRVFHVLSRRKVDVLVSHAIQGFSVSVWRAAHDVGIPVVHVLHDHALVCPNTTMSRHGKICAQQCHSCAALSHARSHLAIQPDAIIAPSQSVLTRHQNLGWFVDHAHTHVIANALPENWPMRKYPPFFSGVIKFAYIGRLNETKGIDTLRAAIPLLWEHIRSHDAALRFELHIAGRDDADWTDQLLLLNTPDLGQYVWVHGTVKASEFLQDKHVLINPSRAPETFSNVVLEAHAMGMPAIVSDRGALPERVMEGRYGWIFPSGDATALALQMYAVLSNIQEVEYKAIACLQSVHAFRSDQQSDYYAHVLQATMQRYHAAHVSNVPM